MHFDYWLNAHRSCAWLSRPVPYTAASIRPPAHAHSRSRARVQRIGTRFAKLGIVKNVLRLFGVAQILRFLISLAKATGLQRAMRCAMLRSPLQHAVLRCNHAGPCCVAGRLGLCAPITSP